MAGKISNFAKNEIIDHVLKGAVYTPKVTLYLCLCTADPTVTGTGTSITETDYAGYVRLSYTAGDYFSPASARKMAQDAIISFAVATGVSTSNISHWCIVDAATLGNMLAFGAFTTPWNVVSGNTPKIASGAIEIEITATVASAAGFTTIAANKMLDHMFQNTVWTIADGEIHFGLATTTLTDATTPATVVETDAAGYAREPVAAALFQAASGGANVNIITDIAFDIPTGDSTLTIKSLFVCDTLAGVHATTDILIAYDNTNVVDQPFNTDDEVVVEVGNFTATLN